MIQLLGLLAILLTILAALWGPVVPWLKERKKSAKLKLKHTTPRVVCFSGQLANGKDMSADYLIAKLNALGSQWHRCAFGDAVKEVFMRAFGKSRAWVEEWKRKDIAPPGFSRTVRQSLQFIGDGFRKIQPKIWVNKLYDGNRQDNIVISDGRYNSEWDSVYERDGVSILVWRPGHENEIQHDSESQIMPHLEKLRESQQKTGVVAIEDVPFDFLLINDGTPEQLYYKIDTILIPYLQVRLNL